MPKRTIRLKEHEADTSRYSDSNERIRELSDDSLPAGPYLLRTDGQGFILTGNELKEDAPDLFVIGDSFVESLFAEESSRFTSQLERGLRDAGIVHHVKNGGYSGMTSLHMLGVLTAKLPLLVKPGSRVLLVIGQSDANALLSPSLYWEQSRTVTPFSEPTSGANDMRERWRQAFVAMVTTIVTFSKLSGFDFAITAGVFRNGNFDQDGVLRRTFRRDRGAYTDAIEKRLFIIDAVRSIAQDHGIPIFDASAEFLERPDFFYDLLHLNHAGQAAYAHALTSWIREGW